MMAKHQKDVDKYEAKIYKLKAKNTELKERLDAEKILLQYAKYQE